VKAELANVVIVVVGIVIPTSKTLYPELDRVLVKADGTSVVDVRVDRSPIRTVYAWSPVNVLVNSESVIVV
jgi:hypothetical protein